MTVPSLGVKLPELLAQLPKNGVRAVVRRVSASPARTIQASASASATASESSSSTSQKMLSEGGGGGGEGHLYLVTRSKLKFRPVGGSAEGEASESSVGGIHVGDIGAHGKAWGLPIRKGE